MNTKHIVKSYDEDLNYLQKQIIKLGNLSSEQLNQAITSVIHQDITLATHLIEHDFNIDKIEHEIEAFAIRMIALRQPVAKDLRNIVAALKVSTHLERIADYATNIAKRSIGLKEFSKIPPMNIIEHMGEMATKMILEVMKAYNQADDKQALKVWRQDQDLDEMYTSYFRELLTYMMQDTHYINSCMHLLFIAKNIERIGDHATNIAEMVYYLVHGTPFSETRLKRDFQ